MSVPEPFVSQLDVAALSWPQFRAVLDVYHHWVTDVWMHADTHTYGVRLANVPLLSVDGLHGTVADATSPLDVVEGETTP